MFKPTSAKDRINYGEVLMPPVGYYLERAIGTTYSLDLETLTAIAISLGLIEDTDSELVRNPISMLYALQKISDKITIFCEAGQIKKPAKANPLCLLLEKMVVTVCLPEDKKHGRYPAFHPKMWLLEYNNADNIKKYRVVIMSRNMTFDHSWDVACAMDGYVSDETNVVSETMVGFLKFLQKQLDISSIYYEKHNNDLNQLIRELPYVDYEVGEEYSEYGIYPLGIGADSYDITNDELFAEGFDELVVVSPFLSGSIIEDFNSDKRSLSGKKRTLITRKSELAKIADGKADKFDVYVMKDDIIDGEGSISDYEEDTTHDIKHQDIHAKIYIKKNKNEVGLYLGSMNATYSAIHSNVELVMYLHTDKSYLNGEKFLDDIMGIDRDSNKNPFELVVPAKENEPDESDECNQAEKTIKDICRLNMKAEAIINKQGKYDVSIIIPGGRRCFGSKIRPLLSNKDSELKDEVMISSLDLMQLSEFYVVSVSVCDYTLERVVMIPTKGIPYERDSEIVKSVIKDRKSFVEYVAFVLGDDYVQSFLENSNYTGKGYEWNGRDSIPAIYEKMLKTSLSDPTKIGDLKYLTQVIDEEDIIPIEFREMYQVFCETLGIE